ncbi:MAG TPA: hypothetical protein VNT79_14125 [Phycisphaerae bacterium]|nr:hypothetical protein [Phycisphaerae bacterium]
MSLLFATLLAAGCQGPERWEAAGPRVYLIEGDSLDASNGLESVCERLRTHRVNARVYRPKNWLCIIGDIDARPHEEAILVGHGHGAFLATQVVRHYAQRDRHKQIEAVISIDAYNKDWPHNNREAGFAEPHCKPMAIPVGHNALKVRNFNQSNPDSRRWGSDLVSTRRSNLRCEHPFHWYEDFWSRRAVTGQVLSEEMTAEGVLHETIDNDRALIERIVRMCRKAALSPYHYTPPEHHPDVETPAAEPIEDAEGERAT